jgi:hypothetical protein
MYHKWINILFAVDETVANNGWFLNGIITERPRGYHTP